jgi:hypothetical protein
MAMTRKHTGTHQPTVEQGDSSQGYPDGSKLLINENPLVIQPTLAKVVGVNEAIILQQIHYWVGHMEKESVFITLHEWQRQVPFLSLNTIRRALKRLQGIGLIIVENHNKRKYDRTNWYRVNYEALEKLMESHLPTMSNSICPNWTDRSAQDEHTYTRDYTENTKENTQASSKHDQRDDSNMAGEDPGESGVCNPEALYSSDTAASPQADSQQGGTPSASYAASNKQKRNPIDGRPLTDEESRVIDRIVAEKRRRGDLKSEAGLRIHLEREARAGRLRMDGYCEEQKMSPIHEEYDFAGIG